MNRKAPQTDATKSDKTQDTTASIQSPENRQPPPKFKKRRSMKVPAVPSGQGQFFDKNGCVPFEFDRDARMLPRKPGSYLVSGMTIQAIPNPKDPERALDMILDAMRLVGEALGQWDYSRPGPVEPLKIDSWKCSNCTVEFRKDLRNLTIVGTYSCGANLSVSIPPPKVWKAAGLRWLIDPQCGCERNRHNPTPWHGPACTCLSDSKEKPR